MGLKSLRSHVISMATVDPNLLHELRNFAASIVLSKLHDHVEDVDMIAPMGNPPQPELLYNTVTGHITIVHVIAIDPRST